MADSRVTSTTQSPDLATEQLENLLTEMAQGSSDALAEFYRRTVRCAYALALSLLQNPQDAQDILQDTYVRAWQMAGKYHPGGKPVGWLLTILRNLAYMKLRGSSRTAPMCTQDLDAFFSDQPAVTSEDRLLLATALQLLDAEERQIVLLHAAAGMKHWETAKLLGLPLGTVLSKYRRALKKMQSTWEEA